MKRTGFKQKTYEEKMAKLKEKQSKTRSQKPKIASNKKVKAKTISKLKKELWELCKQIIRLRYAKDGGWYCYTCGNFLDTPVKAHTGHFITSSICSMELRYSLDNLRVQDYACNIYKSGNWVEFEKRLRIERGNEFVEKLKQLNEKTKGGDYGKFWVENKIEEYKNILSQEQILYRKGK